MTTLGTNLNLLLNSDLYDLQFWTKHIDDLFDLVVVDDRMSKNDLYRYAEDLIAEASKPFTDQNAISMDLNLQALRFWMDIELSSVIYDWMSVKPIRDVGELIPKGSLKPAPIIAYNNITLANASFNHGNRAVDQLFMLDHSSSRIGYEREEFFYMHMRDELAIDYVLPPVKHASRGSQVFYAIAELMIVLGGKLKSDGDLYFYVVMSPSSFAALDADGLAGEHLYIGDHFSFYAASVIDSLEHDLTIYVGPSVVGDNEIMVGYKDVANDCAAATFHTIDAIKCSNANKFTTIFESSFTVTTNDDDDRTYLLKASI